MSNDCGYLSSVKLYNFRNFSDFQLDFKSSVNVLVGDNGVGKTNILEAISLLSSSKGIRGAKFSEMNIKLGDSNDPIIKDFVITYQLSFKEDDIFVGITKKQDNNGKIIKKDSKIASQIDLEKLVNIMWLTPLMDTLFIDPASERRKFLDRIVCGFFETHQKYLIKYEYYLKERLKILQLPRLNNSWLSIIEEKLAELGVIIADNRINTISYLEKSINSNPSYFPKAILTIDGVIEKMILEQKPSLQIENYFKEQLEYLRLSDKESNRNSFGIHRSDLMVSHSKHNMEANQCSTGEQKALIISIILANMRIFSNSGQKIPILLLDEITSHLDKKVKNHLFEEILSLKSQIFMTGTSKELFLDLDNVADYVML